MQLYLAVRGSREAQPRLFPLAVGRTWQAGSYFGPLVNGRYLRDQTEPLEEIPEYIPLEEDWHINHFHFDLGHAETGPWIFDRSINGTMLNGMRLPSLHKVPLHPDDQIRVMGCVIVVACEISIDPAWRLWNDGIVVKLAAAIDEERAIDHLPILADALEEAGCNRPDLLGHLREKRIHLGSCFVLDAILNRAGPSLRFRSASAL